MTQHNFTEGEKQLITEGLHILLTYDETILPNQIIQAERVIKIRRNKIKRILLSLLQDPTYKQTKLKIKSIFNDFPEMNDDDPTMHSIILEDKSE